MKEQLLIRISYVRLVSSNAQYLSRDEFVK